jgi:CO dehydrogenase/acetyl-CoA synthase beta subunit
MMSDLKKFKEKVINKFCSEITDNIFLMIQNDRTLIQEYLKLLEKNQQNVINSSIAKEIKNRFKLENQDLKIKNPKSFLIKSHESFEASK